MIFNMGVVILSNIATQMYALSSYTAVAHRKPQQRPSMDNISASKRKEMAIVLITISWTVPISIGIIAGMTSHCPDLCTCIYVFESGKDNCLRSSDCSQVFKPLPVWYGQAVYAEIAFVSIISLIMMTCSFVRIRVKNNSISLKAALYRFWNAYKSCLLLFLTFAMTAVPIIIENYIRYSWVSAFILSGITLMYCFLNPVILYFQLAGVKSAVRSVILKLT